MLESGVCPWYLPIPGGQELGIYRATYKIWSFEQSGDLDKSFPILFGHIKLELIKDVNLSNRIK